METLPVTWRDNQKVWMTSHIFSDWLDQVNRQMKKRRRRILLFIDNVPSHPQDIVLSNVTVKYILTNTTSVLQRLDQGIIRAFKHRYRKFLMKSLISRIDTCSSVTELSKNINVLDAVHWIHKSWQDTTSLAILKCLSACGLSTCALDSVESDNEEDDIPLVVLVTNMTSSACKVEEFVNCDCDILTEDPESIDWEAGILKKLHSGNEDNEECDEECGNDNEESDE
ncbi:tigger transposable element-derived protein 6-like [Haliotis rubra]|uniref:tigger transposable element-derived protein 6-like n=1 Tax=Haliotis rubra TaxID=36100 RepID=UPI001EE5156C|nr:tigger transposable element-derived protein 6-like [Haliotis rubra]